jgi:hypothetical protein
LAKSDGVDFRVALAFWTHLGGDVNAAIFLSGVSMTSFAASGAFFLKFWVASRDRFYLYFCFACWLMAIERIVALFISATLETIWSPMVEATSWVYLIRLGAFLVIFFAIVEKNRIKNKK